MWEIIERMATDRLWIYTALTGTIFGALFLAYIQGTRISFWVYSKWEATLTYFVNRYGWTWLQQDPEGWKKLNPKLSKKIEQLEERLQSLEEVSGNNRRK